MDIDVDFAQAESWDGFGLSALVRSVKRLYVRYTPERPAA